MLDDFRDTEYVLERLWFYYGGGRYHGRGMLTWKPNSGIHLEAFLQREGPPAPPFGLSGTVVVAAKNAPTLRMKIAGTEYAAAPNVFLHDHWSELNDGRLSIDLKQVFFFRSRRAELETNWWSGSAVLETAGELDLPDALNVTISINKKVLCEKGSLSAILFEDEDNQSVGGRQTDKTHLELFWNLSKSRWTKQESMRWAEAAQMALSMLLGQRLWMLQRVVKRAKGELVEIRQHLKAEELKFSLSLFDSRPRLNKETFLKLTEFFIRGGRPVDVCYKMFLQVAEASRQQTLQAKELLLSTILEAALRTLDNYPFQKGDNSWDPGVNLKNFRERFLSDRWTDTCTKVLAARKRLRHRNAHLDWLTTDGGRYSEDAMRESFDDTAFLSRFYGYMILALAGFKDLEPNFPLPCRAA